MSQISRVMRSVTLITLIRGTVGYVRYFRVSMLQSAVYTHKAVLPQISHTVNKKNMFVCVLLGFFVLFRFDAIWHHRICLKYSVFMGR